MWVDDKKLRFSKGFGEITWHDDKIGLIEVRLEPESDNWNDFRYKPYAKLKIKNKTNYFEGYVLFAVQDNESKKESFVGFKNALERVSSSPDAEFENNSFFTLLRDIGEYRNIVSVFGTENSKVILKGLNDIVYLSEFEASNNHLKIATSSDIFTKSFMRSSEQFFAFTNSGDILKGLDFEELDYISQNLSLKFKMDRFVNSHELNFTFTSSELVPRRINILIGENGTGKSQTLKQFVKAALQQRGYVDNLIDPQSHSGRPMINRLLALGTPGETSNTYPSDSIKNPKMYYRRLSITRNSRAKLSKTLGRSLIKLVRDEALIGKNRRWDIFISALENSFPIRDIVIPLKQKVKELNYVYLRELPSKFNEENQLSIWTMLAENAEPLIRGEEGLYPLSSGQLSFFKFALLACLNIENGSFVLLDEPETHLHPSLISDFINLLDTILEMTGSYSLLATHSIYFVREVPREQVHIYKATEKGEIHISNPRLKTFGADVSDISFFVFDEDFDNVLLDKVLKKALYKNRTYQDIKDEYKGTLTTELLHSLKEKMKN